MTIRQLIERVLDKKTKSEEELEDKYEGDVPEEHIDDQLEMGIKVELEHTSNRKVAAEIARDHLDEDPDYYTKLKKMESK